ncbi:leukocyte receptor cluster member 9-like isoform X2 [Littorina saxatilis]
MDVTLKFQLTDSYPSTVPEISVRSESLTQGKHDDLIIVLKDEAGQLTGQPMLHKLVTAAEGWLRTHGIRPGKSVNANAEVYLCEGNKKPKKQKRKKKKGEEEDDAKKPSMKTADDVIKRIMWDDKLDTDDFLVGYMDRFTGIQEKYFSAFSWEDIATVDYDVLAIPKHRIQYFKYRKQMIWDKPTRMDNVFGSTGSGLTVYDIINNYQEPSQAEGGASGVAGATASAGSAAHGHDDSESNSDDDEDSDDDDGITVTIGSSVNTASKGQNQEADDGVDELEDSAYDPFWQDKMRPNYFLALRIIDPEIRQGVEQIQDYILDNEPRYGSCCMNPKALHITLCTLGLDTPEQVAYAKEVLKRIQPELQSALPKQPLRMEGVSHFYHRVIYAQLQSDQSLLDFVDLVKLLVKEAGVEIRDNHDFVPHMTIMKVTRPVSRQMGVKNIDPWLYSGFKDMHFGRQKIDAVYLCSMGSDRQEDGFYVCPTAIHFD